MTQKINYISRIKDTFDFVISGINGVFMHGNRADSDVVDTLIKMYQSGKKIALASNSGMRVQNMYYALKQNDVPMNIFCGLITAGEIAHYYLKTHPQIGQTYYSLSGCSSFAADGLRFRQVDSIVIADFIVAETSADGVDENDLLPILEQSLHLHLPMLCVGNNTSVMTENGVSLSVGACAERYAMMGGKIISFGKPNVRIASYLTENMPNFEKKRCLVIGDCMATDMRMGNAYGAQNLLLTSGVHQLNGDVERQINDLSGSYGLNVDYYMEKLQW
ncbi:MAG: HAD hydrolase-like protein [Alphaproteobacteria bacterium]|nr:HAD hydrolase-like protein [Alphaproteobacteria bacterium]